MRPVSGFSKFSKQEKINFLAKEFFSNSSSDIEKLIRSYWHSNEMEQKIFDEFSENTLTNFYFPYGIVPNLLVNDTLYCAPMVIEESSVVAACAKSAKFWLKRGGIRTEVLGTEKVGQVHFVWNGRKEKLEAFFEQVKPQLLEEVTPFMSNMAKRGGGVNEIKLIDRTKDEPGLFQLWASFETCDAMGANFINTILEAFGRVLEREASLYEGFSEQEKELQVVMAILSNYTPNCRVKAWVECSLEELNDPSFGMSAEVFAQKFARAVRIAKVDIYRATTHNKGIFNGIDAVVLATGNDFRAVEACGHAYACREGKYQGLTDVEIKEGKFKFSLEIPLSLGTVGGLTALHPLAKFSLDLLGRPSASKLMEIAAAIGLAQNFAALRSLVTSGIQKGHMKMHLMNILNHLEANEAEREATKKEFTDKVVSFQAVRDFLAQQRNYQ